MLFVARSADHTESDERNALREPRESTETTGTHYIFGGALACGGGGGMCGGAFMVGSCELMGGAAASRGGGGAFMMGRCEPTGVAASA